MIFYYPYSAKYSYSQKPKTQPKYQTKPQLHTLIMYNLESGKYQNFTLHLHKSLQFLFSGKVPLFSEKELCHPCAQRFIPNETKVVSIFCCK